MKDISQLAAVIGIVVALAAFILNLIMALAVNGDAKRLLAARGGLYLFGPFLWGIIAFVFSLAGFALYWAVHHSSLRSSVPPQAR